MNCNNRTPHYGFCTCDPRCAVDGIDRELRRIEEKIDCGPGRVCAPAHRPDRCPPPVGCDCDCYTRAEIDEMLSEKAGIHVVEAHPFDLGPGIDTAKKNAYYCRTSFGMVTLVGTLYKESGFANFETFATLPEGFCPQVTIEQPLVYSNSMTTKVPGTFYVSSEGDLILAAVPEAPHNTAIYFNVSFATVV